MRSLRDRIAPLGMTKLWVRIASDIDQQVGVQAELRGEHKVPRLRNALASRPDCSARDDNVTGENCRRDRSAGWGAGWPAEGTQGPSTPQCARFATGLLRSG